jgi:hypothetical protein
MKKYKAVILFAIFSLFAGITVFGQDVTNEFRSGNADGLSAYFNDRLELTITGVDYRVSKAQATEILRNFFKNDPPSSFSVLHKGDKKDSNFAVGKLVTRTNTYRVNIFFRKSNESNLIYLLEIEKENEAKF